jgi:hypothetical protein
VISTEGRLLKDEHGRTLLPRGVNLGGSSKIAYCPDGAAYIREGCYDHRNVSFVGSPFPLEEADEHLAWLCSWGAGFRALARASVFSAAQEPALQVQGNAGTPTACSTEHEVPTVNAGKREALRCKC